MRQSSSTTSCINIMGCAASSSSSTFLRARQRFYKYGSDYFNHAILPNVCELMDDLQISRTDTEKIFTAFVAMDTDGSAMININEFHRYFGWKRGVFTERIFDIYAAASKDDSELSFEEFLVMVWNYCSYDVELMATYVWNIFDIDGTKSLSLDELDAMMRMIHYNQQQDDSSNSIMMSTLRECAQGGSTITFDTFLSLVSNNKSIIQPAFDIQTRLIDRTTGDRTLAAEGKTCWELYRERRRAKFPTELPDFKLSNGKIISSVVQYEEDDDKSYEHLSTTFLTSLFHRVERNVNAPEGFDSRLEEERYVDELRDALAEVEAALNEDLTIDSIEERKEQRKRLWSLIGKIKDAHITALYAEVDRDLGLWDRREDEDGVCGYSSEDDIHDLYEDLLNTFEDENWPRFVDSFEARFGPSTTCWERMFDPDQQINYYFQWQTGQKCFDQQLGDSPPAICEVCDALIDLTDYKCFNCDAPRSVRNRKKYRGRISLEEMEAA